MLGAGSDDVRVVFGAATEGLEAGLAEGTAAVSTATKEMTASIESMTAGIKAALGPLVALTALFESFSFAKDAISDTIQLGVELEKLAEKTGIAIESLSKLRAAAMLADIDAGDLDRGFKKLATSIQEAHQGTGTAATAFKAMGIAVDDARGKTKPMDDLLLEIAEKFHGYADGANKAALASDIFGARFGQVLIPFLNKGADGIKDLEKEAEKLGFTLTDKDAAGADKAKKAMLELQLATDGLKHSFGTAVAGPLAEFENWLTRTIEKLNAQKTLMGKIGVAAMAMGGDQAAGMLGINVDGKQPWNEKHGDSGSWGAPKPDAPRPQDEKKIAAAKKLTETLAEFASKAVAQGDAEMDKDLNNQLKAATTTQAKKSATEIGYAKVVADAVAGLNRDRAAGAKHLSDEEIARARAIKDEWLSVLSAIGSAVRSSIDGMLRGSMTMANAVRNLGRQALTNFIAAKEKELEVHIATERAKDGATVASVLKKVALETWAAIETAAVWALTAVKTIAMDAARGAAAAWASISAIPVVGPFLAPAAAAAALAGIMAMAHNVKSAAGGYDIPSGVNPVTQLHAEEMVLPKELANSIRTMVGGGGAGGSGGGNTYHIHAMDAESFRDFADRHQDTFYDAVNSATYGRRGRG